jgi:hypothetical protein
VLQIQRTAAVGDVKIRNQRLCVYLACSFIGAVAVDAPYVMLHDTASDVSYIAVLVPDLQGMVMYRFPNMVPKVKKFCCSSASKLLINR